MNAITDLNEVLEQLPITSIRASQMHVQTLRRQRFDAGALLELAASIKSLGVQQPIVVRPVDVKGTVKYEIVCGERRWIAADRAGLGHVPAIIRALTDEQVLEIQLVENLQREGLHPLEEGQGYRELLDMKKHEDKTFDAEAVGNMVGKSRAYVYARMKLLDLCPAAREALQAGTLDASKALLLARITGDKLQQQALKYIDNLGDWASYSRVKDGLRDKFMTALGKAPFALDDASLCKGSGKDAIIYPACTDCHYRSGNDSELLNDLDGNADVCTNRACFDGKIAAHWKRERDKATAAGQTILTGDDAKAIVPGQYEGAVKGGYVNVDAECDDIDFEEPEPTQGKDESDEDFEKRNDAWYDRQADFHAPTYRALIGDVPGTVLAQGKDGLVAMAPVAAVTKALKAKGIKIDAHRYRVRDDDSGSGSAGPSAERMAEIAREDEQRKVETEYRARVFKAIWSKWKGPLKRADLERIAENIIENTYDCAILDEVSPGGFKVANAKESDLLRVIACTLIAGDCNQTHGKPALLLETAARFKIDAKKIRTEVVRDLKPTAAPKADKPAAKKKATKK
jgi:ParB/RepB/Spo0J family partition protein